MEAKLIVVGGKASKPGISLRLPATIGRSPEAGLALGHRTISRQHAELFEKDGVVMIRDLGSLNGTVINGHRINEAPLPPGTQFSIGPLTFRIEYEPQGEKSESPAQAQGPAARVGDDHAAHAATEPMAEFPDFEPVEVEPAKKVPINEKAVPAAKGITSPIKIEPAAKNRTAPVKEDGAAEDKAPGSAHDPFEDLLNDLQ